MEQVFLTKTSSFLPNQAIENDQMENILGMVANKPSRVRSVILRQNGIKKRHYAMDTKGNITHSNAELTATAIKGLFNEQKRIENLELLCCGTSIPDQLLPSHAAMVHGLLKTHPMEIMSPAGVCCAGMHAFKIGYMSVATRNTKNAVCTGSEMCSPVLNAKRFSEEIQEFSSLEENPMIAFEKDFIRWMLSDGAGAVLLENKPNETGISFRIEWVESISYANELPPCMYAGAEFNEKSEFISWKSVDEKEWMKKSIFAIKQDTRLLGDHVIEKGIEHIANSLKKHNIPTSEIDYFLPHISSMFFKEKLKQGLIDKGLNIPDEKWFLNLPYVGNTGSASIYLMMDELFHSGKLKNNDKIFLIVPESGRFSYVTVLMTVIQK